MGVLKKFGILFLLIGIFLGYVYKLDNNHVIPLKRENVVPINRETTHYTMSTIYFPCSGLKCEAFFYKPKGVENPPVIIMAHGFGAQKDFTLDKFADVFSRNHYAVFLFDYRSFGGSEGEPMNLISPTMHLEDWESAVEYVAHMPHVDTKKIGLWGTSFSGGHVIVTAAKSPNRDRIKAVISQVPYLRAFSSFLALASSSAPTDIAKLSLYGLVDKTRELLGLSRYYVPIYGQASDMAILCSPSSKAYADIIPKNPRGGWQNKCPAGIAITLLLYNPLSFAQDVKAPTLILYDTQDDLCPSDDVKDMAKNMPNVQLRQFSSGHFAIYLEQFEDNIKAQLQFLEQVLPTP